MVGRSSRKSIQRLVKTTERTDPAEICAYNRQVTKDTVGQLFEKWKHQSERPPFIRGAGESYLCDSAGTLPYQRTEPLHSVLEISRTVRTKLAQIRSRVDGFLSDLA